LPNVLAGVEHRDLDQTAAHRIGTVPAASAPSDVVDGHVAVITNTGDTEVTSDANDITHLLNTRAIQPP
jgi:hypothetical protein